MITPSLNDSDSETYSEIVIRISDEKYSRLRKRASLFGTTPDGLSLQLVETYLALEWATEQDPGDESIKSVGASKPEQNEHADRRALGA